jgi:hypothetical protein
MQLFVALLATLAGLVCGIALGLIVGGWCRGARVRFWLLIAAGFVGCSAVMVLGQVLVQMWMLFLGVGLLGGWLTGMRYGYGQPLGPYRALDEWTRAENLPERAMTPEGEPSEPPVEG